MLARLIILLTAVFAALIAGAPVSQVAEPPAPPAPIIPPPVQPLAPRPPRIRQVSVRVRLGAPLRRRSARQVPADRRLLSLTQRYLGTVPSQVARRA
jgi:hypothetical protein